MRKSKYTMLMLLMAASLSACGQSKPAETTAAATTVAATTEAATEDSAEADQAAADHVASLIDVFRQVQEQICNRRRRQKNGTTQIFSGLVKCADCGPFFSSLYIIIG